VLEKGGEYVVKVRAVAEDGQANKAVVDLLARHLHVHKSSIKIVSGLAARRKIVDIGVNT
jgi:uncharacterized protein